MGHLLATAALAWVALGAFAPLLFSKAAAQESLPWYARDQEQLTWIDRSKGLSHNSVFEVLQDHQGYLWAGTIDGLNRYDGRVFEVFRHDPGRPGSLSNNTVRKLFEDRHNNLWVRTEVGVDRFDRTSGDFRHYGPMVQEFLEGSDGQLWITASDGIYRYQPEEDAFVLVAMFPVERREPVPDLPTGFVQDDTGRFWVLHRSGAVEVFDREGVIQRTDSLTVRFPYLIGRSESDQAVVTHSDGASSLDLKTGAFELDPWPQSKIGGGQFARLVDRAGREWWAGVGLSRTSGSAAPLRSIWSGEGRGGLNTVWDMTEDRDGSIWAGTLRGLLKYEAFPASFSHSQQLHDSWTQAPPGPVMAIAPDQGGDVWIGTLGTGLLRIDGLTGQVSTLPSRVTHASLDVWSLTPTPTGELWLGTGNGLARFNPKTGARRLVPLSGPPRLVEPAVYTTARTADGTIWAGTLLGLHWFDPETGNGGEVSQIQEQRPSRDVVVSLRVASDGRLWATTSSSDVYIVDPVSHAVEYFATGDPAVFRGSEGLWASAEDRSGRSWFGGDRGLALFDEVTGDLRLLGPSDGVPGTTVYGIVPDEFDALWVSTNAGLLRLSGVSNFPETLLGVRRYAPTDEIRESEFNRRAVLRIEEGSILFGGIDGVTYFRPAAIGANPNPPPVVIESVDRIRLEGLLAVRPYGLEVVELHYDDAGFDLHFTAPSFGGMEGVRYSVILEGVDPAWYDPAGPRVRYMGVPPGNYTFRVRAASADGVWNEQGASLDLVIPPPFWAALWFRLLSGTIGLSALVAAVRVASTRRLKEQVRSLELERSLQGERNRISRDLHDHVGSQISGIVSGIELARLCAAAGSTVEMDGHLEDLDADARRALTELRETVWSLHHDQVIWSEFGDRVSEYLERRQRYLKDMTLTLEMEGDPERRLNPAHALGLFRIVQEAVSNAVRHSGAKTISVVVAAESGPDAVLRVQIMDDGTFQSGRLNAAPGMGITGMRERVVEMRGSFWIEKNVQGGTTVRVHISPDLP